MTTTQPLSRIRFAEKEVVRYTDDVHDWVEAHDRLADRCWPLEDLAAKANFLFDRIMDLDIDVREAIFVERIEGVAPCQDKVVELLRKWLDVSLRLLPHLEALGKEYKEVDGFTVLRKNARQAGAILAPDDAFFGGEPLAELRDAAINAHQRGETEFLLDDEKPE